MLGVTGVSLADGYEFSWMASSLAAIKKSNSILVGVNIPRVERIN